MAIYLNNQLDLFLNGKRNATFGCWAGKQIYFAFAIKSNHFDNRALNIKSHRVETGKIMEYVLRRNPRKSSE